MQVRIGTVCPVDFLPAFSVDTVEEAEAIVNATCQRGLDGHYYSNELLRWQEEGGDRLQALYRFTDQCRDIYRKMMKGFRIEPERLQES